MSSIERRYGIVSAVGLAGVVALTACGGNMEAVDAAENADAAFVRVINVETTVLAAEAFTEVIRLTGTVQANRDIVIAAEESGVVRQIFADRGTVVTAGEPLIKIDDRILVSQVAEARARAELARETWARRKRVWEEERIGSELAYLEARFASEQADASLEVLEERLARTIVRAPFGGVVEDRLVEVGSMVTPGSGVARLVDLASVKITAGVPERYAADIRRGAAATVTLAVLDDLAVAGRISFVGATVNPSNRTFPVEFTLPNPGRTIKPEMIAGVRVVRRELPEAVVVPQEALVRVEEGFVAYVVSEKDGGPVAEVRTVETGPSQQNRVVVSEGLAEGDRLIVQGQHQVAGGDRVRVVGER